MVSKLEDPATLHQLADVLDDRLNRDYGLRLEPQRKAALAREVIGVIAASGLPDLCSLCRESAQRSMCADCAGGKISLH